MPPSPTASYTSTAVPPSTLNLLNSSSSPPIPQDILSRADVAHSISAYESLLSTAKAYRKALAAVSTAASSFGAALEACARCRGTGPNGHGILNASGLQYLIGSNMNILSEGLYRGFEVPLLHELDLYKEKTTENEERYKKEEAKRGKELRKRESEYLKLARQKQRSIFLHLGFSSYRSALTDLTQFIDELDQLKYEHWHISHTLATDTSNHVLDCAALIVRAEVEIFEKVAQKGWDGAGGGLDDLIARAQDPFAPEACGDDAGSGAGTLFSILPAHSILPSPHSPVMHGVGGTISANSGVVVPSSDGAETTNHLAWGQKTGKYRAPLTDALSPPARNLYSDEEDQGSIFSGPFSSTVALSGGPTSTSTVGIGEGDSQADTESLKSPPSRAGPAKLLPPPTSPSQSSSGWAHGDDDVQRLELNSPVGLKYQGSGSTVPSADVEDNDVEVATIRPLSSDGER
ncbi:hypothetical protein EV426DRAFT_631524 [Tirmania nivea]|nr:hypothetical protein EV426DRAFT_631524 [Tirmania nivea]